MFSLSAEVCDTAANAVIVIPGMSHDGRSSLPITGEAAVIASSIANSASGSTSQAFVSAQCGGLFGAYGTYVPNAIAASASTVFGRLVVTPGTASRSPECLVCKCTLNITINGFHKGFISSLHIYHHCILQREFSRSPWVWCREPQQPRPKTTDSNWTIPR